MLYKLLSIRILFVCSLLCLSGRVFSQSTESKIDTTNYIPIFYNGALEYNLMIAASKGYTREINRLVLKGADIFSETEEGVTPLILPFPITTQRLQKYSLIMVQT